MFQSGYIHTEDEQYIVEPVKSEAAPKDGPRPHLVYRRHAPSAAGTGGDSSQPTGGTCQTAGTHCDRCEVVGQQARTSVLSALCSEILENESNDILNPLSCVPYHIDMRFCFFFLLTSS